MSKIISFSDLVRQQHLAVLRHQGNDYREREDYLARLRRLLFQVEAQMRQAEIQQLEVFRELARHFQIPLPFPDLGDRVALQELFSTHPFIQILKEFFGARISDEECYRRILELRGEPHPSPAA